MIKMDKEKIFGWLLMFVGIINMFVTISLIKNPKATIGTIFGLFGLVGITVPCLIVGSILNETAPRFIMNFKSNIK